MPHIHDKIDMTAEVFIVHKGRVLLRKHDKYNMWLSVGGHVELHEDPNEAAVREVKEEVGLDVQLFDSRTFKPKTERYKELIPPEFTNRHRISDTHEHVTMVYFASSDIDVVCNSEDEKSEGLKWFSESELNDPQYELSEHIRTYAAAAIARIGE